MKRRSFLQSTAASAALLASAMPMASGFANTVNQSNPDVIDPIIPFRFYSNRKEAMLAQMIDMRQRFGLRRFLLTAPMDEVRLTGFPYAKVYHEIGELVLFVKEKLAPYDIEVGWWCAPSLRSGKSEYQSITDLNGQISEISPCPLDPKFREFFSDNLATVARIAKPFMIQLEDDFELSWQPPNVRFACFCPYHLAEFAKKEHKNYSREELIKIFSTVTPKSLLLRRSWAELSRDSLAGFAKLIRDKIDVVAPETRISLCQSGSADFDGDFTEAVTRALAGKTRPAVRLYGSSYSSDDAASIPATMFHALYSRQHLPADFEFYHESDTYPHTRFFMSAAKIRCLITIAFAYRYDDSLFYTTQYLDNPLEEIGYSEMFHAESKRFLALKKAVRETKVSGCEILYNPFGHIANPYNGKRPDSASTAWSSILGRFGIPHTTGEGRVKLVSGKFADMMSDQEIEKLLSGSLFLDGSAAYDLCKRGFGAHLGAEVSIGQEANFCYEGVTDPSKFSNINGQLMYNLIFAPAGSEGGSFYVIRPDKQTEILTNFLDAEEKPVIPGLVRYENKLGGRIAITAFDLNGNRSSTVFNYKKKELIKQTIEWLGFENLPFYIKDLPNVFCVYNRSNQGDFAIITVISLCADPFKTFVLDTSPDWFYSTIDILTVDGKWEKNTTIAATSTTIDQPLIIMSPVILKITKKS